MIKDTLTGIVSKAFIECGFDGSFGIVSASNRPDLCQYQCNGAMACAKAARMNPMEIASKVSSALEGNPLFSKVEALKPGFLNLTLTGEALAEEINRMLESPRMLLPEEEPRTIVMDFGGANIAKPLHVGHLRTAILGRSLSAMGRFLGHNVITDVHLGDWGLQMGQVIAQTAEMHPELPYFDANVVAGYPEDAPFTVLELEQIYPAASKRCKDDPAFAEKAKAATVEFQAGRPGYVALWRRICAISIADLKRNYGRLDTDFDYWYGESDAAPYLPKVIEALESKGLLVESQGAKVVQIPSTKEDPIPPMIIVKSDGGDNYGSTDLATLMQRMEDWRPNEVCYIVDSRQSLHFKQVFTVAQMAGIVTPDVVLVHANNGTINGKDGKPFKTREGGVMRLSTLIDSAVDAAYAKTSDSDVEMTEEEQKETAEFIGIAALKIGDLINHRTRDYIFDLDRFLQSDGKTGPYLLYCAVRINSVLKKAAGGPYNSVLPPSSPTETSLMLSLMNLGEALLRAFSEKAPNALCEALFTITGLFNRFYTENKILSCPDEAQRDSWLALLNLTNRMLRLMLELLGIKVPEKM
jgi:arginyl-tRNA synthetase